VLTELIGGAPPTVDVSVPRLERFARGELIGEPRVV
jgi:hypothetical protein